MRGDGHQLRAHLVDPYKVSDVVQEKYSTPLLRVQRGDWHSLWQQALDCAVLFDSYGSSQVGRWLHTRALAVIAPAHGLQLSLLTATRASDRGSFTPAHARALTAALFMD